MVSRPAALFCTLIDVLNLFCISLQKNQRIGVTRRSACRLFPALSTLPANVKKPDGLLPISGVINKTVSQIKKIPLFGGRNRG
ncbi:hypothetical protein F7P09_21250 [Klebsiella pneumoniae]|nr:hypothetical protein F7P09_21250 [Klebsiella pneumoniae]